MKILEVNYLDLAGKRFNGFDLISDLKEHDIKQIVLEKSSNSDNVIPLFNNYQEYFIYLKLHEIEKKYSLQGTFSITSQILMNSTEYKECDKIHLHSSANYKMSLYSLIKINEEKDLIVSFHDPWYLTGRCVHFFECDKWKTGCNNCKFLNTHYNLKEDNCNTLWNLKKNIFKIINPKIIISSDWMKKLIDSSPIITNKDNVNIIPFGIDINKFKKRNIKKAKYNILEEQIVLFFREDYAFKGTEYIIEALKKIDNKKQITIITCGQKGLLRSLKKDFNIKEFGYINEELLIDLYSICDIFLMPSTGESFGLMGIEAMACECPIIVFKNTALENIVEAPNCGLAAEYKSSESLFTNINYLVNNKKDRILRGQKGRKIVEKKYNLSNYLDKINHLYKKPVNTPKENISDKIICSQDDSLLTFLNEITNYIFNKDSKIKKVFYYDCIKTNKQINFSDLGVQKTIFEYCEKLYNCTLNEKMKIPIIIKIKFWLKKHRRIYIFLKHIIRR